MSYNDYKILCSSIIKIISDVQNSGEKKVLLVASPKGNVKVIFEVAEKIKKKEEREPIVIIDEFAEISDEAAAIIDDIHLGEIFSGDLERDAEEISSVKGVHSVPIAHV